MPFCSLLSWRTARILEFASRPHSLTADDVAARGTLAPTLDGLWPSEFLADDDGNRWGYLRRPPPPHLMFFVGRIGRPLQLDNMNGEAIVSYDSVDALTTLLGDAIGRRLLASV